MSRTRLASAAGLSSYSRLTVHHAGQADQPEVTQVLQYAHYKPRTTAVGTAIYEEPTPPEAVQIDPLAFLPPVPDLAAGLQETTVVEDETGRTVKRARRTVESGKSSWQRAVPYEASQLIEYETRPLPTIDEIQLGSKDDSGPSSLLYFLETFNHVSLDMAEGDPPLPLRQNKLRKRAAASIHSNILHPSDDSLSGAVATPQPRHARKQPGWLPFPPLTERPDASEPSGKAVQSFPPLHPFITALPTTITESVPTYVLPHITRTLVPTMHPRYPTAVYSIRTMFETVKAPLFNRTTRIGPPGPLLENGAAGHYEIELEKPNIPNWSGETAPRMVAYNYDWEVGHETADGIKERQTASTSNAGATSGYTGPTFPQMPARQPKEARERRGPAIDQVFGELPMTALPPMPAPGEFLPPHNQEGALSGAPAFDMSNGTFAMHDNVDLSNFDMENFAMPDGFVENFDMQGGELTLPAGEQEVVVSSRDGQEQPHTTREEAQCGQPATEQLPNPEANEDDASEPLTAEGFANQHVNVDMDSMQRGHGETASLEATAEPAESSEGQHLNNGPVDDTGNMGDCQLDLADVGAGAQVRDAPAGAPLEPASAVTEGAGSATEVDMVNEKQPLMPEASRENPEFTRTVKTPENQVEPIDAPVASEAAATSRDHHSGAEVEALDM